VRRSTSVYPPDWKEIAKGVKDAAGWACIRCGAPHQPAAGYTLTVHHADLDPSNNRWFNLLALCQRCHLRIQGKVILERPWVWEHTDWFKPYVAGYYALKYLGEDLDRATVMARLDVLLDLERAAVLA
jgi:5-methylcytosine-specific restriction endonuclease McrA